MNDTSDKIQEYATTKFMKLGIRSVSMDDIASDLGVSKKTLYKFYDTKESLVDECMTTLIDQEIKIISEIQQTAESAIDEMAQISRHAVKVFKQYKPALIHDLEKYYVPTWKKIKEVQSIFIKSSIEQNINRGIQEGVYRSDINSDIVSSLYVTKALTIASESTVNQKLYDPSTIMKQHILYHLYGILSADGLRQINLQNLFN